MATKKEKEDLKKLIKSVDNKWEMISILWVYRQKEVKNVVITILTCAFVFAIIKAYPTLLSTIWKFITGVIK